MNTETNVADKVKMVTDRIEKFVSLNLGGLGRLDQMLKIVFQVADEAVREAMQSAQLRWLKPGPLKVKRWPHFIGDLPQYQSAGASGFDVRACLSEDIELQPGQRELVPTGLSFEIPPGFELQARPRSGLAIKQGIGLVNSPGTIDADYRGEVKLIVINLGQEKVTIKNQDRIAQLVLCPVVQAPIIEVTDLAATERGAGGFGSTGV